MNLLIHIPGKENKYISPIAIDIGPGAEFYYFEENGVKRSGLIDDAIVLMSTNKYDSKGNEVFDRDVMVDVRDGKILIIKTIRWDSVKNRWIGLVGCEKYTIQRAL